MGSGPGNWASGEAHQLTEGAGDLPERVLHGGDIAGQHHRAGEAIEKTDLHRAGLGGDVAGDNRCFTGGNGKNADGGDRVRQTQLFEQIFARIGNEMRQSDLFARDILLDHAFGRGLRFHYPSISCCHSASCGRGITAR